MSDGLITTTDKKIELLDTFENQIYTGIDMALTKEATVPFERGFLMLQTLDLINELRSELDKRGK